MSGDLEFTVGAETSDFDRGMSGVSKYTGEIVDRVADKVMGLRDISHALATALGLNLEKIAERVARFVTDMSEEEAASLKKVADLSDETAKIYEKLTSLHRTEEQSLELAQEQQQRLFAERDRLLASIGDREAKIKAARADENLSAFQLSQIERDNATTADEKNRLAEIGKDLAEKQLAIVQLRDSVDKKAADRRLEEIKQIDDANKSTAEKEEKTNFDRLMSAQKITTLKQREAELESQINDENTSEVEAAQLRVKWADAHAQRLELEDARAKSIAGSRAEELEYLQLQQKVTEGIATGAEAERYKQIKLQREERAMILDIEDLEAKAITGTLTPAENERLLKLSKQKDKLDEQIQAKGALIKFASNQATAEAAVADEMERQAAAAKATADEEARARSFAGTGSPLGMQNLGNISTDVLNAEKKQLEDRMNAIVREYQQKGYTSNPIQDNYYLQSQIDSISRELAFRQDFTAAYSRGGRSAALQQFVAEGRDATSFDTAIANMSSWAKGQDLTNQKLDQTNKQLMSLSDQLAKSPLFPKP